MRKGGRERGRVRLSRCRIELHFGHTCCRRAQLHRMRNTAGTRKALWSELLSLRRRLGCRPGSQSMGLKQIHTMECQEPVNDCHNYSHLKFNAVHRSLQQYLRPLHVIQTGDSLMGTPCTRAAVNVSRIPPDLKSSTSVLKFGTCLCCSQTSLKPTRCLYMTGYFFSTLCDVQQFQYRDRKLHQNALFFMLDCENFPGLYSDPHSRRGDTSMHHPHDGCAVRGALKLRSHSDDSTFLTSRSGTSGKLI
jgi:hypothetical protein